MEDMYKIGKKLVKNLSGKVYGIDMHGGLAFEHLLAGDLPYWNKDQSRFLFGKDLKSAEEISVYLKKINKDVNGVFLEAEKR